MLDSDRPLVSAAQVRTLQIIVAAMALGALAFMAIVFLMPVQPWSDLSQDDRRPIVTYVAVACGMAALFVGPFIAAKVAAAGRRKLARAEHQADPTTSAEDASDQELPHSLASRLMPLFSVKAIVAAAIDEGAALFLCVAYIMDHNKLSLIFALLLVVGLLIQFPTREQAQRWLADQVGQTEDEHQSDGQAAGNEPV
ncbi:MAG: hypothetical protein JXQ75_07635 [Phycisphaerae bacterium]|nr:hypothetical protein [Phycisphaerae bacterium]